jgi:ankyrin repeat protein
MSGSHVSAFFDAIRQGELERVHAFLETQPTLASAASSAGESAVLAAAYRGKTDIVKLLIASGAVLSFFDACASGEFDVVRTFVRDDRDMTDMWSGDGFTGLHLASFFGQTRVVRYLLDSGSDIAAVSRNPLGVQPLHAALASKKVETAQFLISRRAPVNTRQAGEGLTPLHYAAAHGHEDIVRQLLKRGADIAAKNSDGKTPLMMAEERGHASLVALLSKSIR